MKKEITGVLQCLNSTINGSDKNLTAWLTCILLFDYRCQKNPRNNSRDNKFPICITFAKESLILNLESLSCVLSQVFCRLWSSRTGAILHKLHHNKLPKQDKLAFFANQTFFKLCSHGFFGWSRFSSSQQA